MRGVLAGEMHAPLGLRQDGEEADLAGRMQGKSAALPGIDAPGFDTPPSNSASNSGKICLAWPYAAATRSSSVICSSALAYAAIGYAVSAPRADTSPPGSGVRRSIADPW